MSKYTPYHTAIRHWMEEFAKYPNTLFVGQQVMSEDFYDTLTNCPPHSRREMPVAEDMQLGLSIGLALEGYLPISIFQRMDFIPRAMDQLVNHLNLVSKMSGHLFNPKVIIRTTVGSTKPLDVGIQHNKDLTHLMKVAVDFPVLPVKTVNEVNEAYKLAKHIDTSIMIIEYQDLYYKDTK